jgi:hypothetical protein
MDDKRQQIIAELKRVAELLGTNSVTQREFSQNSNVKVSTVKNAFGSWNRAIDTAGLTTISGVSASGEYKYSDEELLDEIRRLAAELGKPPSEREMNALGRFSGRAYERWGTFSQARKVALGETDSKAPVKEDSGFLPKRILPASPDNLTLIPHPTVRHSTRKRIQYGEPIDFRGLRHAPVNEQGVVYMFGMVSRELGFLIESIRTAYPDCEGKWLVDEKRQLWENVLIEFEFRSRNFLEHGHNANECDVIVCWIHDWSDCPSNLTVIELKSEIGSLPK